MESLKRPIVADLASLDRLLLLCGGCATDLVSREQSCEGAQLRKKRIGASVCVGACYEGARAFYYEAGGRAR